MKNKKVEETFIPPAVFPFKSSSWDKWLKKTEKHLVDQGYKKYDQKLNSEDFAYWKSFSLDNKKIYQVGLFFYDFRKHGDTYQRIGVQFECMLIDCDGRVDLTLSKNISLKEFETVAYAFYNAMVQYYN